MLGTLEHVRTVLYFGDQNLNFFNTAENLKGNYLLGHLVKGWEANIRMGHKGIECGSYALDSSCLR